MDPLLITLTKAGLSAIVGDDTASLGPVVITQLGLTDATFTVASTLEALPGEFKRIDVSGQQVGDDTLHLNALDASAATYTYRGFALYLADGTLFAVYGQAGPIAAKAETSTSWLVLDIKLAEGQADNISFGDTNFSNPPATTTRQGVVELATITEARAGTDTQRVLTPAAMQAALLAMLLRVDGAESGVDADLFHGLPPAYFTDIVGRLGYTPLNQASFTAAEILGRLQTVDGADSDLDADLLDGHHGDWYADIAARLGYTPQDAAEFSYGSNANGYWRKMPDGLIEQWGELTAGESGSPPAQNFPIPFTDFDSINLQVTARSPNPGATNGNSVGGNKLSVTQFNVFSDDLDRAVFWRAIGEG
ncbi:gp53-like domain-containing protein [Novosphingobium sediminicola]|uniref:Putative tail fiber protein gp53-like C-terminal domain-containing protein n=1 Tax=Novosphingobium sediminicola TaxID=563162 RepID=A0A7W6G493_9SPHN|nr:hypothetical protein [Novosphingobium sediminicola]MBB3953394.1 hypothetical protein [Novosphingobium sediminicola]